MTGEAPGFAVFAKRDDSTYVQATAWHESRGDAELDAELNTDLGMEGQPHGRMGVLIDGHVYIEHRHAYGVCTDRAIDTGSSERRQ